ncbi:soluble NSF attachment protein [Spinellus fusiger]|nr:soluble NSF attachment protein [Spinellus fusiger]
MLEHQAHDVLLQAEKKLSGWSWFSSNSAKEEAAELYEKAGNTFKLAQQWSEAGKCFVKAAELYKKSSVLRYEASKAYESAARCFKKNDCHAALAALQQALAIDKDGAHFRNAAKHHQDIAELYECELVDLHLAMDHWEEAAKMYMADDSQAMVNKCWIKVAHFAAQLELFARAIEKFEAVAVASMNNPLTQWSLKEYFLKASLCHLCVGDSVAHHRALTHYCSMDVTFENTREYQFIERLVECIENEDEDMFTQNVHAYDQISQLDAWKTSLLLKVKKSIAEPCLL